MSVNKTQIALVSGSIILIVLLLFANTKLPPNKEEAKMSDHAGSNAIDLTKLVQSSIDGLASNKKLLIQKMDEAVKSESDKKAAFENIINELDSLIRKFDFSLDLNFNGSSSLNFIPFGKITKLCK